VIVAGILGAFTAAALYGVANPAISTDLNAFAEAGFAPLWTDATRLPGATYTGQRIAASNRVAILGMATRSFTDDLYNRIYVSPRAIDLGGMVAGQQREVVVWNAFIDSTVTLTAADLVDGEGLDLDVPVALPAALLPLQERIWTITVLDDGPPSTQAVLNFVFTGLDGVSVTITGTRLNAWVVPADWGQSIDESLTWLTDYQQPLRGGSTRIPLRAAPRRTWEFSVVEGKRERRIIENLLYDWTSKAWALPVWPDMSRLSAPLSIGDDVIAVSTAGLDFNVGSIVMLWTDAHQYELQEVAEIAADQITLARGTTRSWPVGTRLYPCRRARLTDAPTIIRKSGQVITSRARFESDEPCDWPAVAPVTTYLGVPVFEDRPETSNDPTSSYARDVVVIDGDVGLVAVDDFSGLVRGRQSHAWKLYGRTQRSQHRSLLYWLQGRAQNVWLPTWQDDLEMAEVLTETGTVMVVAWCGVTRSLRLQPGRRHIRIELTSGQVFHREVQSVAERGEDLELLQINAALGVAVTPAQVRMICWMALSTLDSDRVEITHVGSVDGLARSRVAFASDGGNEP
jgi:hypothetical protein